MTLTTTNPETIRILEETIRITHPFLDLWHQGYSVKRIADIYFEGNEGRANDTIAWGVRAVFELDKILHPERHISSNRSNSNSSSSPSSTSN